MTKPICKHCGLTLQGTDKQGEDICVECLADLCFPSSNYSIKEGCIRQSTDNPINNEQEQSLSKASECDESEANKEETDQ